MTPKNIAPRMAPPVRGFFHRWKRSAPMVEPMPTGREAVAAAMMTSGPR